LKTPAPERAEGRRKLAAAGKALPGGEAPIPDVAYLKKAIRSVGRLDPSKRPALKALIIRRARELNAVNEPGVKGTWPFEGANETGAIDLASSRMPVIRGAADVQMGRTAPGVISVMHKSSGMKVGTITPKGTGYGATHSDGKQTPASGSQQGALAGLIRYHNQQAAQKNAKMRDAAQSGGSGIAAVKGYAGDHAGVDLASVPSVTSSDGPKVTTTGDGKAPGMSPECAKVYKKLRGKGMGHGQALALAKRAAAMHAKAAAKAA
jgi:hypothetical protein